MHYPGRGVRRVRVRVVTQPRRALRVWATSCRPNDSQRAAAARAQRAIYWFGVDPSAAAIVSAIRLSASLASRPSPRAVQ